MSLTQQDLKQIRFIVDDVVSDIREDVKVLKADVAVLKADVGVLKADVLSIKGILDIHDRRLSRVEENTAVCRRILERNELSEKSGHGKRIYRLESGVQKIPSVFKP
jgi:hypothetical protein